MDGSSPCFHLRVSTPDLSKKNTNGSLAPLLQLSRVQK
ncbi:hypothetical protein KIS4809_4115 [Bacillus sp. ZZV12-4809]|nr:hypothetical protein KIS4809_4115 [Bacillus sp. ZZV12-4809]